MLFAGFDHYVGCYEARARVTSTKGDSEMGDRGKRDKTRKETQKQAKLTQKEKRKAKREKKNK